MEKTGAKIIETLSYFEFLHLVEEKIRNGFSIIYARYNHSEGKGIVMYQKIE